MRFFPFSEAAGFDVWLGRENAVAWLRIRVEDSMSAAPQLTPDWWQSFFDDDYALIWSDAISEADTRAQCNALWQILKLDEGSRVLDAGCGFGRLARPLAERGAVVLGVDQSEALLASAERSRGNLTEARLRYVRHDLRQRLTEKGFDAAINTFTGIGYGTESDDAAILRTLHDAVRPGGFVFLDVIQRDAVVAFFALGGKSSRRRPDGILVVEESTFNPVANRIFGTWYWAGAGCSGQKSASMRVYTISELIHMLESAGLRVVGKYLGISTEPFRSAPPAMGGRIGLLAERPQ